MSKVEVEQEELNELRESLKNMGARIEEMSYMLDQAIGRSAGLNRLIRERDQQLEQLSQSNTELQTQLREYHDANVSKKT